MRKIICWIRGHKWEYTKVKDHKNPNIRYSLGWCSRCHEQSWIKYEIGFMMGMRFVVREKQDAPKA